MKTYTQEQWESIPSSYRNVWTTERTDWDNWEQVRHLYMGKRTALAACDNGATCLEIEGIHFEIKE